MAVQPERETTFLQLQQQMQQLAGQVERMQQQMAELQTDSSRSSRQVTTLIEHLTDSERTTPLLEQLAEMATALNTTQEQLTELTQRAARQDQLERLVEVVAGHSQMEEVTENLKKLTRTQFKSNTLGESKSGQIEQALATLRALATQREEIQQDRVAQATQQIAAAQRAGRADFAAELLPALDSIELALTNGTDLLARQQERIAQLPTPEATSAVLNPVATRPAPTQPTGFWQRLFGTQEAPAAQLPPPSAPVADPTLPLLQEFSAATTASITAWLDGLTLVSERLTALLVAEEIEPIEALHQPFDPQLHVAVESVVSPDMAPNTIVRVLRRGYRRHARVIRYAEVVVARSTSS